MESILVIIPESKEEIRGDILQNLLKSIDRTFEGMEMETEETIEVTNVGHVKFVHMEQLQTSEFARSMLRGQRHDHVFLPAAMKKIEFPLEMFHHLFGSVLYQMEKVHYYHED